MLNQIFDKLVTDQRSALQACAYKYGHAGLIWALGILAEHKGAVRFGSLLIDHGLRLVHRLPIVASRIEHFSRLLCG